MDSNRLRINSHRLHMNSHRLRMSSYRIYVNSHRLRINSYRLNVNSNRLHIVLWSTGSVSNWGCCRPPLKPLWTSSRPPLDPLHRICSFRMMAAPPEVRPTIANKLSLAGHQRKVALRQSSQNNGERNPRIVQRSD
jgi:hypothetical protein